jgi:dTMP kinase
MSLIVIEGLDGAGKSTQVNLLKTYLGQLNLPYEYLHFPRTEGSFFGDLVARFLRGEFGENKSVNPYLVALIYAEDRQDAKKMLLEWINQGKVIILDRYVYSNIAYQCAKVDNKDEKERLQKWILELEFEYYNLPKPGLNVFFDVPFMFTTKKLTESRTGKEREYLQGMRDIHEEDLDFQSKVREIYLSLADQPSFVRLDCSRNNTEMLSPSEIFAKLQPYIDEILNRKK